MKVSLDAGVVVMEELGAGLGVGVGAIAMVELGILSSCTLMSHIPVDLSLWPCRE